MHIAILGLLIEAVLLFAIPPHFAIQSFLRYHLYYPDGVLAFPAAYVASYVLQVAAVAFIARKSPTAAGAASVLALILGVLTFNPTAYQISIFEWLAGTAMGLLQPQFFFTSLCQLFPLGFSAGLVAISSRIKSAAENPST